MALTITGHYPSINATGVFRNEPIRVYFNKPIVPQSLTWDTYSIQDKDSFTTVIGNVGVEWNVSGKVTEIVFVPSLALTANNEYSVYVFGSPNSVISLDGEQLAETYSFNFITGTGYYDVVGEVGIPTTSGTESFSINLNGINPVDISNINSFEIYNTNPKNQQPNVELTLSGIQIIFTGNIISASGEIANLITIEEEEVL